MRLKFYYGDKLKLTNADKETFSRKGYRCQRLLQTKSGKPVAVLQSTTKDIWMVQCGFSTVYFGDYADAMAYCRSRYCELDGGPIGK